MVLLLHNSVTDTYLTRSKSPSKMRENSFLCSASSQPNCISRDVVALPLRRTTTMPHRDGVGDIIMFPTPQKLDRIESNNIIRYCSGCLIKGARTPSPLLLAFSYYVHQGCPIAFQWDGSEQGHARRNCIYLSV